MRFFASSLPVVVAAAIGFAIPPAFAQENKESRAAQWAVTAELCERRLEKHPDNEKAWADLVEARIASHDLDRAQGALDRWRSKVPQPGPAIENLTGKAAFEREDFPAAVQAWKRYAELAPNDANGWNQLGVAEGRVRDWKQSADAFSRELAIHPSAKTLIQRARCFARLHDWASAAADARKANEIGASEKEVQKLFPIFERSADWLPKVKALDAAITQEPQDVPLLLDRAELLFSEGLISTGKDDLDAALKLKPESLRARVWNGALAWDRDQKKEAGETMKIAIANFTPEVRARLKTLDAEADPESRARFLLSFHQPLLALHEMRDVDGSPAKALALLDLSRMAEARPAVRRAIEVSAGDAATWLAVARLEFENGSYREALDAAQHSLKIKKTPEAETLRKNAIQRLGKPDLHKSKPTARRTDEANVAQASSLWLVFPQILMNPNGISASSPGLRGTSYPGKKDCDVNPEEGCDRTKPHPRRAATHFGVDGIAPNSQGSRSPRTARGNPGLEAAIPLGLTGNTAKV